MDRYTAVVPARIGSTRVNRKILQTLSINGCSKSLLEHKLDQLRQVFNLVMVSAGEEELLSIAEENSCATSVRDRRFIEAGYKATTAQSIREVIKDVETEYVAWCPAVVPFHNESIIAAAIEHYTKAEKSGFDSLVTVVEERAYFWSSESPVNYFADQRHVQSQLLDPLFKVTNGLYLAKTETMRKQGYFLGNKPYRFCVPWYAGLDIDTDDDLKLARLIGSNFEDFTS